ncbi:NAD-dependent epimerase/dehydratase family protein [Ancylobacter polymorphus]|uniref:UDP-glucose 4-epimerase n=1 Tax=Ancylobacter polymorphus TaxID=223390 RepID=A0ABU0BG80_9HYPH|nr:NAD-dependent epimerase/dehydratase family protein [Ancylobacter polymorphus]MDQ0304609.1 UDP-glucose 4-epimerase [Ancylobacter polymorphus]
MTRGNEKIRLAIAGATGFIARGLLTEPPGNALQYRAVSRHPRPDWVLPATEWATVPSYADRAALESAFSDSKFILHLADAPSRLAARDAQGGLRNADAIIAAARATGIEGIILASSVYAREGRGSYGAAKQAIEQRFLAAGDLKTVILRLPPVYGPGCKGGFAALARLSPKPIPLPLGGARAPRAYLSRTNLVSLFRAIALAGPERWNAAAGRVFEPWDGQAVSTRDLAKMIGGTLNRSPLLIPVPPALLRAIGTVTGRQELVAGVIDGLEMPPLHHLTAAFDWRPVEQMPQSLSFLAKGISNA